MSPARYVGQGEICRSERDMSLKARYVAWSARSDISRSERHESRDVDICPDPTYVAPGDMSRERPMSTFSDLCRYSATADDGRFKKASQEETLTRARAHKGCHTYTRYEKNYIHSRQRRISPGCRATLVSTCSAAHDHTPEHMRVAPRGCRLLPSSTHFTAGQKESSAYSACLW